MVMGPTHALSGAVAYLAISGMVTGPALVALGGNHPSVQSMGILITAGAALGPDVDSYTSTITSSFGIFGRIANRIMNAISLNVYHATRTKYDNPNKNDGHRTLFHTTFMALFIGGMVAMTSALTGTVEIYGRLLTWGQVSTIFTMFIFIHLALAGLFEPMRKLRRKYGPYLMMIVSFGITLFIASSLPENTNFSWVGVCVALGWFIHLIGDMITKMGVPMAFPFTIRGKRWWDVSLPSFLRITAGGKFEYIVLLPLLTIAFFGLLAVATLRTFVAV